MQLMLLMLLIAARAVRWRLLVRLPVRLPVRSGLPTIAAKCLEEAQPVAKPHRVLDQMSELRQAGEGSCDGW